MRREHLKKEEADLAMEKEKLEKERQLHLRELKRSSNEMASSYKDHALLNKRYLMLSLLGKGGFRSVNTAFFFQIINKDVGYCNAYSSFYLYMNKE